MAKIKGFVESVLGLIVLLLIVSLPLSLFNAFGTSGTVCKSYGYYLPMTFVMCNINKTRN